MMSKSAEREYSQRGKTGVIKEQQTEDKVVSMARVISRNPNKATMKKIREISSCRWFTTLH